MPRLVCGGVHVPTISIANGPGFTVEGLCAVWLTIDTNNAHTKGKLFVYYSVNGRERRVVFVPNAISSRPFFSLDSCVPRFLLVRENLLKQT